MEIFKDKVSVTDKITLGGDRLVLFAGPCAAESYDICFETGAKVKEICTELGIDYVFKSSFDKANRTSASSYRGHFSTLIRLVHIGNNRNVEIFFYPF